MKINKKGISLIVLIITIIVIIILAGAVILNLTKNNPIDSAKKAKFVSDIDNYKSELLMWITGETTRSLGELDVSKLNATKDSGSYNNIKIQDIITSLKDSNASDFQIKDGELCYDGTDEKKQEWSVGYINLCSGNNGGEDEIVESNSDLWEFDVPTKTITRYLGSDYNITSIVIPNYIDGIPVERISGFADSFYGTGANGSAIFDNQFYDLIKVKISNGIKEIGNGTFFSMRLQEVIIPNSVTSIGDGAFYENVWLNLNKISFPQNLQTIGQHAFSSCGNMYNEYNPLDDYGTLTIPNSVTNIGIYAFARSIARDVKLSNQLTEISDDLFLNCYYLNEIVIPDSVIKIGNYSFSGSIIKKITLSNNLKEIGEYAFNYSRGFDSLVIPDSVTTIGTYAFTSTEFSNITLSKNLTDISEGMFKYSYNLSSIVIPNGVTTIGYSAFDSCENLSSVTIPNSVTSISYNAFSGTSLTTILIPNSVNLIENGAFSSTTINSINVDSNNPYYTSENGILFNKNKTKLIRYPIGKVGTSYEIPTGVTNIEAGAFSECSNLTSITIPNTVTDIGGEAFSYCSSLTSIIIPSSVKTIGGYTFYGCSNLSTITIKKAANTISGAKWGAGTTTTVLWNP